MVELLTKNYIALIVITEYFITIYYDYSAKILIRFFFSSRRRHTRSLCDWSSDVCSSDLHRNLAKNLAKHRQLEQQAIEKERSEERRVGKECRSRWSEYHGKKNVSQSLKIIECQQYISVRIIED